MAPACTLLTYFVFLLTLLVVATGHLSWWVGLIVVVAAIVVERQLLSMRRIVANDPANGKGEGKEAVDPSALPRATPHRRRRRRRDMVLP